MAISICCEHCGSTDVRRDALAVWNTGAQEWELLTEFDNADCDPCGGETRLEEIAIGDVVQCMACSKPFNRQRLADGECKFCRRENEMPKSCSSGDLGDGLSGLIP